MREYAAENWLDRIGRIIYRPIYQWLYIGNVRHKYFLWLVERHGKKYNQLILDDVLVEVGELRTRLHRKQLTDIGLVSEVFALISRISQIKLDMRHHNVQIIGGFALLQGVIAEMQTGEGKTLTATLAAGAVALSGLPVHIITVNDYLAERDSINMMPIYTSLGLTVGVIREGMGIAERQQVYACDIVYCSNKELAFDFLKDRITLGDRQSRTRQQIIRFGERKASSVDLILRGMYFAIVDEADSVLIDEARTPLIIAASSSDKEEVEVFLKALNLAKQLTVGVDYDIFFRERYIQLTIPGKAKLTQLVGKLNGVWKGERRREMLVNQALSAVHLYQKDRHYLERNGRIEIIDEHTGRVMTDRSWEAGLHQMIEAKEGCDLTDHRETLARTSYQNYFRRYIHLSGMTGTAKEVKGELWSVYGLIVKSIPTFKPVRRRSLPTCICPSISKKVQQVLKRIKVVNAQQRPILVGTNSVAASEQLSNLLKQQKILHKVLNARQDRDESELIKLAGESDSIMVATSMAGRGTDIKLDYNARKNGGLHVILTELHESKRIDRQLIGRCARQGDPGSFEYILSLDDGVFAEHGKAFKPIAQWLTIWPFPLRQIWLARLMGLSQFLAERFYSRQRAKLINMDEQVSTSLAFTGHQE